MSSLSLGDGPRGRTKCREVQLWLSSVRRGAKSPNSDVRGQEGATEEVTLNRPEEKVSQPQSRARDLQAWDETQETPNQNEAMEKMS